MLIRLTTNSQRRAQRGSALIAALVLVLVLTMVVAGAQMVTVQQLKEAKAQRNYEVALQMAEAGANAYVNELANGFVDSTTATSTYKFMPPSNTITTGTPPTTIAAFRALYGGGTIASKLRRIGNMTTAAASTSGPGYYVYDTGQSGGNVGVYAFGWCNGAIRMIHLNATSSSIFDWAAVYGMDPNVNDTAWKFAGSPSVIGGVGAEGNFNLKGAASLYDGPVVFANGSYAAPYNNADPTVLPSSNGTPSGHVGSPGLASPLYRHYARSLNVPTADQEANTWANSAFGTTNAPGTSTPGVDFFKTHNDNATGLRLLVINSSGAVRELNDPSKPYNLASSANNYVLTSDSSLASSAGMKSGESFYAVRAYPGNYYVTNIVASGSPLILRTYTDSERNTIPANDPNRLVQSSVTSYVSYDPADPRRTTDTTHPTDPANPNTTTPNASLLSSARFWVGTQGSNDPQLSFDAGNDITKSGVYMEYSKYASRFRIYMASTGGVSIKGTNKAQQFRINLLAYNKDSNGAGYGSVSMKSSVYVYGSLMAWTVDLGGSSTVEKDSSEPGAGDTAVFRVTSWSELQ